MIFDAHSDVWTHVTIKNLQGERDIFKKYHLKKYREAGVDAGIFVIWIDQPYDIDAPKERTIQIANCLSTELMNNQDILKVVRKYSDFEKAVKEDKMAIVIGIEGLSAIGKNVELLNTYYMLGARHAGLTWNEENELATGMNGNKNRGLTKYGVQAIKTLEKLGMIVDVSHANEKTFWDIYDCSTKPFIASHSNCTALCNAGRNLTDRQLKAIAQKGGVVGLNSYHGFVHEDIKERTIDNLAKHVDHMVEVMGIDHVGFGFDFVDYLREVDAGNFSSENKDENVIGFENITKVPNLIQVLKNKGYSDEDVEKIKYKNFLRICKEIMG